MSKNDIRFTNEFKQQIVELYRSGQSANYLSSEYGVLKISIYKWIKQLTPIEISEEFFFSQGLPSNAKTYCRVGNGM